VIKVYNTLLFYKYERIAEKAIQGTFDIEKGCWCGKYGWTHNSSPEKRKRKKVVQNFLKRQDRFI